MQVVKQTKDENLAEIANIIAAQSVAYSIENSTNLLEVLKGIIGKTASDKRKVKEEEDRLVKLKSPEYTAILRNAVVESYSVLSEAHVEKLLDEMILQHKLNDCQEAVTAKIMALSEDFFAGRYEGPTTH